MELYTQLNSEKKKLLRIHQMLVIYQESVPWELITPEETTNAKNPSLLVVNQ